MAFNIKINAYVNGKDVTLLEVNNCSSLGLKKINAVDENNFNHGVLVNSLYKMECKATTETGSEIKEIRKT